jgi:hypothetical protein
MKSKGVSSLLKKNISYYILGVVGVLIIILLAVILYKVNKKDGFKTSRLVGSSIKSDKPLTGYWMWTWNGAATSKTNGGFEPSEMCDIGIRFGGEVPVQAIKNNIDKANTLTKCSEKFLNLGGGDPATGGWVISDFDYINTQFNNIKNSGWTGVCFDIEVCPVGVSFVNQFTDCFAKCKAAGLKVLVTMSHIVPYDCKTGDGQGMDLVNSWINDSNIDYISPQLYSQGDVLETDDLSIFKNAKAKIIPSIPYDINWPEIQDGKSLGIVPAGYLSWSRLPFYCGKDINDATSNCKTASRCLTDTQCGNNKCFNGILCDPIGYCGTTFGDASKCTSKCNGDGDCPADSPTCYSKVTCSGGGGGDNTVNLCGTAWNTVDCVTSPRCPGGTRGECSTGQDCFKTKCSGGGGGGGNTVNLCGTAWNTVDCMTSPRCPGGTKGECSTGQDCFKTPC